MKIYMDSSFRGLAGLLSAGLLVVVTGCGDSGNVTTVDASSSSGEQLTTSTAPTTVEPTTVEPTTGELPTTTAGPASDSNSSTGEPDTTGTTGEPGTTGTSTTEPGTTGTSTGPAPICGDASVDDGEECDDGNQDDTDTCTNLCMNAICGDSVILLGVEECDDGNMEDTDACTNLCKNAVCGDGIVGPGEACDDGNDVDDDECSNACAAAGCGDGIKQPGEECDDGNDVDTDACLSSCVSAQCGDMTVQAGVEECDDGNDDDTDMCLGTCKAAKCGDAIVQAGVEDCDDGNMVDTDMCLGTCKAAKCGDGKVQAGVEDCDDGNMIDNDACNNTCKVSQKIIFVTSQMYTGNLGGLAGADAKCQARAVAGLLPGTYLAWLSDNTGSPASRMTKSAVPYVRPDGTKIANDWTDLTDGGLIANVDMTELKGVTPLGNTSCAGGGFKTVWTNTTPAGAQSNAASSCSNWSSEAGSSAWGRSDAVNGFWTQWCSGGTCSWQSPIYCVQQ